MQYSTLYKFYIQKASFCISTEEGENIRPAFVQLLVWKEQLIKSHFLCVTLSHLIFSFFKYSLIPSGALFAEYDLIFEKKAEEKELISFGSEKNSSTKIYKRLYTFL